MYESDEFGADVKTTATVGFLRDDLKNISLVPQVGDIIVWDNEYFELYSLIENQYFVGKNPETELDNDDEFGWNQSLIFSAHLTRRSKLNFVDERSGVNPDEFDKPSDM